MDRPSDLAAVLRASPSNPEESRSLRARLRHTLCLSLAIGNSLSGVVSLRYSGPGEMNSVCNPGPRVPLVQYLCNHRGDKVAGSLLGSEGNKQLVQAIAAAVLQRKGPENFEHLDVRPELPTYRRDSLVISHGATVADRQLAPRSARDPGQVRQPAPGTNVSPTPSSVRCVVNNARRKEDP